MTRRDVGDAAGREARGSGWRGAGVVLAVGLLLRLIVGAQLPLVPDEAYYWEWSRNLSAGYFDHPPAIAVAIRAGMELFALFGAAATPLAVRFVPILLGFVAGLAAVMMAARLGGGQAGYRAALIITVLPLAATGLVLATPDAPLLASLSVATLCVVAAVQSPLGGSRSLAWWIGAGAALGIAFSSKYTSILLPLGVLLGVAIVPGLRSRLREAGPYVACLVATAVFLPVLLWNAQHDWISFGFQLEHGLGRPRGSPVKRELDLLGGQIGLVTPVLFAMMTIAVWRATRSSDDDRRLLAVVAIVSFAFFMISAWRKSVEANWPAIAYIPAIALAAAHSGSGRWRRWMNGGVWFAGALTAIIYVHSVVPLLPIPARKDPVGRAFGWRGMAAAADRARGAISDGRRVWLAADRYQDAAQLSFNAAGHPFAFSLNVGGRRNQYDLWPGLERRARAGDHLVVVLDDVAETHPAVLALSPHFRGVAMGEAVALTRSADTVQMRRIWVFDSWRGSWYRESPP
jgi:4-amino-4-deoxy-L-arabinose transferase-like glycosyltransferase